MHTLSHDPMFVATNRTGKMRFKLKNHKASTQDSLTSCDIINTTGGGECKAAIYVPEIALKMAKSQ